MLDGLRSVLPDGWRHRRLAGNRELVGGKGVDRSALKSNIEHQTSDMPMARGTSGELRAQDERLPFCAIQCRAKAGLSFRRLNQGSRGKTGPFNFSFVGTNQRGPPP